MSSARPNKHKAWPSQDDHEDEQSRDDSGYSSERKPEPRKSRFLERLAMIPEEIEDTVPSTTQISSTRRKGPRPKTFFSKVRTAFDKSPAVEPKNQDRDLEEPFEDAALPILPVPGKRQLLADIKGV
jgi:hypothetical protein